MGWELLVVVVRVVFPSPVPEPVPLPPRGGLAEPLARPDSTLRSSRTAAVSLYRIRKKAARKERMAAKMCTTSAPVRVALASWLAAGSPACAPGSGAVVPSSCDSIAAKKVVCRRSVSVGGIEYTAQSW